jgi:arylamine N-acetyltransferase
VTFPGGARWVSDVAFGGDGPTEPIELKDGASITNLGTQTARLVRGFTSFQTETDDPDRRLWIYECRNADGPWNAFYCFSDKVEWCVADFAVCNWFTGCSPDSFQTTTVIVVKFLRREGGGEEDENDSENEIYGKRMLVNGIVKENLGGKTRLVQECRTEEERVKALKEWFGIEITEEEQRAIVGFQTALS